MSEPKLLVSTSGSVLESKDEEFIYFHSNYPEKTSVLVVEIVITRELNSNKTVCSGGFAVCPIFDFTQASKTAVVQSGTPRQIGSLDSDKSITQANRTGKTMLTWDMRDHPSLITLNELTPMNCFVGRSEIIPGLEGDYFPLPRSNMAQPLSPQKP
jgi:hypothetical protein